MTRCLRPGDRVVWRFPGYSNLVFVILRQIHIKLDEYIIQDLRKGNPAPQMIARGSELVLLKPKPQGGTPL